jgi:hypothetical protein
VRECGREKKFGIGQVVKSKESTPPPKRQRRAKRKEKS